MPRLIFLAPSFSTQLVDVVGQMQGIQIDLYALEYFEFDDKNAFHLEPIWLSEGTRSKPSRPRPIKPKLPRTRVEKPEEEYEKESDEIRQELSSESPRASVLVGAAWLEEHLFEYIRSVMPDDEKIKQVFISPTHSFWRRIDVAHKLGIIGDNEKETLHIVRNIRNKFAHRTSVSFDDEDVAKLIDQLDGEERKALLKMIDIAISKKRMKDNLSDLLKQ